MLTTVQFLECPALGCGRGLESGVEIGIRHRRYHQQSPPPPAFRASHLQTLDTAATQYLPDTNNSVEISHETAVLCDLKSLILQFLYVPVQTNICTIRFTTKQKYKYEGSISILFGSNSNIVFHEPFSCVWPRRGEWSSELET